MKLLRMQLSPNIFSPTFQYHNSSVYLWFYNQKFYMNFLFSLLILLHFTVLDEKFQLYNHSTRDNSMLILFYSKLLGF
jgi:hypothetical protein